MLNNSYLLFPDFSAGRLRPRGLAVAFAVASFRSRWAWRSTKSLEEPKPRTSARSPTGTQGRTRLQSNLRSEIAKQIPHEQQVRPRIIRGRSQRRLARAVAIPPAPTAELAIGAVAVTVLKFLVECLLKLWSSKRLASTPFIEDQQRLCARREGSLKLNGDFIPSESEAFEWPCPCYIRIRISAAAAQLRDFDRWICDLSKLCVFLMGPRQRSHAGGVFKNQKPYFTKARDINRWTFVAFSNGVLNHWRRTP